MTVKTKNWTAEIGSFQTGVNLGGWLSQREVPQAKSGLDKAEHYRTFITEKDIRIIADWGFDHVRLPFDAELFENDELPFTYMEEGLQFIDKCIEWCHKLGLGVLLDFHRAPGQSYSTTELNPLLNNPVNRDRYVAIWKHLTARYVTIRDGLIFELLNEVVDTTGYQYKSLIRQGIEVIRELDPTRYIMIGGNIHNSVHTLKELHIEEDPAIVYTFHFYEPVPFTHQKAYFCEDLVDYNQEIDYPGEFSGFLEFLKSYPQHVDKNKAYAWTRNDKKQMEYNLREALLFLEHTGKPLYCGEFGVIDTAPAVSAKRWLTDLIGLLNDYGIPRAYWSYKDMDYGLVDMAGNVRDLEWVETITQKSNP